MGYFKEKRNELTKQQLEDWDLNFNEFCKENGWAHNKERMDYLNLLMQKDDEMADASKEDWNEAKNIFDKFLAYLQKKFEKNNTAARENVDLNGLFDEENQTNIKGKKDTVKKQKLQIEMYEETESLPVNEEEMKNWIVVAEKDYKDDSKEIKAFTKEAFERDRDEIKGIIAALTEAKKPAWANSKEYKALEKQAKVMQDLSAKMAEKGNTANIEERIAYEGEMKKFENAAKAYLDHKQKDGQKKKDAYKIATANQIKQFVKSRNTEFEKTVQEEFKEVNDDLEATWESKVTKFKNTLIQIYPNKKENIEKALSEDDEFSFYSGQDTLLLDSNEEEINKAGSAVLLISLMQKEITGPKEQRVITKQFLKNPEGSVEFMKKYFDYSDLLKGDVRKDLNKNIENKINNILRYDKNILFEKMSDRGNVIKQENDKKAAEIDRERIDEELKVREKEKIEKEKQKLRGIEKDKNDAIKVAMITMAYAIKNGNQKDIDKAEMNFGKIVGVKFEKGEISDAFKGIKNDSYILNQ